MCRHRGSKVKSHQEIDYIWKCNSWVAHIDALYRSFKITYKPEHFKTVVGANIWPSGSYIRPYRHYKTNKVIKMANLSVVSYNCRGFNTSNVPRINKLMRLIN